MGAISLVPMSWYVSATGPMSARSERMTASGSASSVAIMSLAAGTASGAALRDLVDELVELLVLRLEELVQVVELQAGHVPVVIARLGVEQILVRQQGVQDLHDRLTGAFGDRDVDFDDLGCLLTGRGFRVGRDRVLTTSSWEATPCGCPSA